MKNIKIVTLLLDHPVQFAPLRQLMALLLASNNISSLRENNFAETQKIAKLDLRNNSLASIDHELLSSMPKLKSLLLNGNNIPCTCEVHKRMLLETAVMEVDCLNEEGLRKELFDDVKCETPSNLIKDGMLPGEKPQLVPMLIQTTPMNSLLRSGNSTEEISLTTILLVLVAQV